MLSILNEHKGFWTRERRKSLYTGILFLVLAFATQFTAGLYSTRSMTNFVGDVFLDNLPTINLDYVIVDGAFLVTLLGISLMIARPRYIIFSLKVVALFMVTRSFFVVLTHIGIYPHEITLGTGALDRIYMFLNLQQSGFFFSGHTGLTFLGALIFWQEKIWRYFFIATSVLFGTAVLFAHVHYSIDVFAAPFITYAIFKFAQHELFKRDYVLVNNDNKGA